MTASRWRAAIVCTGFIAASAGIAQQDATAPPGPVAAESMPGHETLDYAVEWRLIPAGSAKFTFTSLPNNSASASEVRFHLESAGLVSRLFRVNDDFTSMMGPNFCGQNTFMSAHEGSRSRETRVTYDQQAHKVRYSEHDLIKNSTSTQEEDIPSCTHDVLGGLMVLRTLHPEPGKSVQVPVSDGKKVAQSRIESQRREEINTPMGVRKTIRYEAFVFNNVLYKRSAHLHIWLTDDNLRLPVQLQVHLQFAIGTITFKLEKQERS
jgi:hypothetical protein